MPGSSPGSLPAAEVAPESFQQAAPIHVRNLEPHTSQLRTGSGSRATAKLARDNACDQRCSKLQLALIRPNASTSITLGFPRHGVRSRTSLMPDSDSVLSMRRQVYPRDRLQRGIFRPNRYGPKVAPVSAAQASSGAVLVMLWATFDEVRNQLTTPL